MNATRWLFYVFFPLTLAMSQVETELACLDCHRSGTWYPLAERPLFDHNRNTLFELRDSHEDLACTQCHRGESIEQFHAFAVKGTDCRSCHQDVHQNYWGDRCEDCHTPQGWDASQFYQRHDETLFPLLAAHRKLDCYLCHTRQGQLPSIDCQDCHSSDFRPELSAHAGLTSTTDCSTCHGPTRWDQILAINHDAFFPIYSGNHRGEWSSCGTCHTQAGNYEIFTCFGSGCHSISRMNSEHCEGSRCERCDGRTYPSSGVTPEDCYFCHPRGNESKCGD